MVKGLRFVSLKVYGGSPLLEMGRSVDGVKVKTEVGVVREDEGVKRVMVYMVMLPRGESGGTKEICATVEESARTVGGTTFSGAKEKKTKQTQLHEDKNNK